LSSHRPLLDISRTRQLEYKGKGYFSGKIHTIKATVSPPGSHSVKHTIEGQWHTQTKDTTTCKVFTDVTTPKEEVTVGPTEDMKDFESRKLWALVSQGIREGDYELASREKSKIEVGPPPDYSF
jgi:oxysterol-binding protein-related protein 9/10/11